MTRSRLLKENAWLALLGAALIGGAIDAFGGAITSTAAGGIWNFASTWVQNKTPVPGDDVTIVPGASVTLTNNANVKSVTFGNTGVSTAVLTVTSNATLTLTGALTEQNANNTNTSALIQGAGTIQCASVTVGGTMQVNVNSADFTATLTSTISFLVCTGNLSIKALYNPGPAAADQGIFALGSGLVTANSVAFTTVPFFGPILTLATGNQNGTLYLSGANPFTSNPGGTSTFTPNGTNATVIYAGTAQAVYGAIYQNLALTNSGTKTITNSTTTVNGTLSMQGPGNASAAPIYGPSAVLQYNGIVAQTNGPELTAAIPNLAIYNANGVTLTNSSTVSNALTLAGGNFITGTNRIIIGTNGSVSGESSSSYVSGNLQKDFNPGTQAFVFPIGNSEYAPVSVANLSVVAAGSMAAYTTNGAPPQIASSGIITNQDVNRYWVLTNSSGTFGTYSASFNYPAADLKAGAVPAGFGVSAWSGGVWSLANVSGTPTTNLTSITGQSGFGTFVIGDLVTTPAANLAITSINGGVSPVVSTPFNVTVQSQDTNGTPRNVTVDTTVTLSLNSGSGVLGGTLTGTIPAGSNGVVITGVTYSVGESGVQIAAAASNGQSLASAISAPFTVSRVNQSITFPSPGNQTYGVAPITLTATASSGLPVSYSILSGPAMVSSNILTLTGAGSVTIQASQSGNANWNAATPVNQTISVAQKTVTGSFTANNKVYDGTTTASIANLSLSGVINSDIVSLSAAAAAFADKNVGNGKTVIATGLSLNGANAGNYLLASTSATNTANISAATLTVTANNTNRAYGALNPAFIASYSGFVVGDNSSVLSGSPSLTTSATTNSPVAGSPYAITAAQGTLSATNYSFSFVNASLTISAATLTVTANNTNRSYGAANPGFTASYSGFVNGDNTSVLSGVPSLTTTATASSSVAGNPYTITAAQGTLSAANYSFSFVNGSLTVTPVTLTVTANNTNRNYGAANPAFTASYSGFVNGENASVLSGFPSLTTTATASSSVAGSPYAITAAQGTLNATNYSFSFVNGILTISSATLTVTANNTNRSYGAVNPVFTASYSGFAAGDDSSVLSGSPSLTTTATTNSPVAGSPYTISAAQGTLSAANYNFSFANGTLTVTPAILTVVANDTNRPYGRCNPAFTFSYSGFVNGEDTNVLSGSPSLMTTATTNSPVAGSPYAITAAQGTLSAANYSFSFTNSSLTITPADLIVIADNKWRLYGTTNPMLTFRYGCFVNGEDTNVLSGSPSLSTAADINSQPGPYTIDISGGTLSAANYQFIFENGVLIVDGLWPTISIHYLGPDADAVVVDASGVIPGSAYKVFVSPDLKDWMELGTVQSSAEGTIFITNSTDMPAQFYRIYGP